MNQSPQQPLILPSVLIENIIHVLGIFGNLNILLATYQSRKLRSNFNLLIATQALFYMFGEFGGIVEVITKYAAIQFDSYVCFYVQLVPAIGVNMATTIMLMIGVDRVIAIKFPVRYSQFESFKYLIAMLLPGIVMNVAFIPFVFVDIVPDTMCTDFGIYIGVLASDYFVVSIFIYVCIVLVYIYMMYLVRWSLCSNVSIEKTKKIQKSIVIIMLVTVGSWLIGFIAPLIANLVGTTSVITPYFINFIYVGMAASYYIYFYSSVDYRRAFISIIKNQLCCYFERKSADTNTTVVTIVSNINSSSRQQSSNF